MKMKLFTSVAFAALMLPGAAFAQSTGTIDSENNAEIVVTGRATRGVAGIEVTDAPKAREVLNQAFIARQVAGQSVDETINQLPGVSFQNNDPYGSSGGRLTIRGFGPDRISQTLDGFPTNDTGNYAIYSNQLIDPELVDQVNISLGSTDVDSPTASASGSTVNIRSITPTKDFGARLEGSYGDLNYFRIFGLVNTGEFTKFGTKAWLSASHAENNIQYSNFGGISKNAYNFKVYQPLASNGDFFSIAGNWNDNKNQNTPDYPLRNDAGRVVGTGSANRFPTSIAEAYINSPVCQTAVGRTGVVDAPNTCGTGYEQNINPSRTGNIRINSRVTLAPGLVFTADGAFQYTKANGGSYGVVGSERTCVTSATIKCGTAQYGLIGGTYYTGIDLNHDGDKLDTVELDGTSTTVTHRYTLTTSLRYDITPTQTVRVAYAHEYGRHRQTGELGYLQPNGQPFNYFPIDNPIVAPGSNALFEKRNRLSYAVLDQFSGEYNGKFLDSNLVVTAGLRMPFLKRNLNNYCFTTTAAGGLACIAGTAADITSYAAANPYTYTAATNTVTGFAPPMTRQYTYNEPLPSGGVTYKFADGFQVYASYSKGIQVPGTDNLYQALYYPKGTQDPVPELTDNFDGGIRYTSNKIQAQVGPWYTLFTNRLASSYDPILDITTYRNLGKVDKYGIDGSISYQPIHEFSIYAYGSYLKSKIKDDVVGGKCTAALAGAFNCTATNVGTTYYLATAGKREAGSPVYTIGARGQLNFEPLTVGIQAKRTGRRYLNDQNLPIYTTSQATTQIYGATAPAYTVVDLDARVSLGWAGLNDKTYLQLNVTNLFNEFYIGSLGTANSSFTSVPFTYVGSPRTVSGTLNVQF